MVDSAERRILLAKAALWRQLATQRQPSFLRRNLNHILDQHELAILRSKRDPDALKVEMIANERRHAGWDFPTRDMLADLLRGQKPVLNITSIQLRHPSSRTDEKATPARRARVTGDPDWLPHPDDDSNLPCQVTVAVTDPRAPATRLYADLRQAVLRRRTHGDHHATFDVELDEPFALELEKLFVVQEVGSNGSRHWKRTSTAKYTLTIGIQCQDDDDSADLLNQLEGGPRESYQNAPANESILRMVWHDLPECPPVGKLLALHRTKGHKAPKLPYEAEVFMGWKRRRDSALVRYNRSFRERHDANLQLPTPSASDDLERPRSKCAVKYYLKEGAQYRSAVHDSLDCLFCLTEGEHSSFERLHLHYLTHHDHFKYEVDEIVTDGAKTIWVLPDSARPQTEREAQNARNFSWRRPDRPFNITEYVNGDESWTLSGTSATNRPKTGTKKGKQRREPEADHSPARPRERRKRLPEEVKDFPIPLRKRNRVPNVPGVRFYRTISKQLVEPETLISDSDDDIDDRWLEQSQRRDLVALGLEDVERSFHELFNRHLDLERPSSDLLVTDAVVRFARRHQSTLQEPSWHAAFRAKLDQLHRHHVIEEETVTYCFELTAPTSDADDDDTKVATARRTHSDTNHDPSARSPDSSDADDDDGAPVIEESPEATRAVEEILEYRPSPSKLGLRHYPNLASKKRRSRWRDGKMEFGDRKFSSPLSSLPNPRPSSSLHPTPVPFSTSAAPRPSAAAPPSAQTRSTRACVCGQAVTRLRDGIACGNPACGREFHLACVGLDRNRREMGWRCEDCTAATA